MIDVHTLSIKKTCKQINSKIGTNTDAAGAGTVFAGLAESMALLRAYTETDPNLMFVINGLLSDSASLRDWAFRQDSIGQAINEAFELNSDALAACTSVEEIAANSTAITAISSSTEAIAVCKYNNVLLPKLINYVSDDELILAAGLGYLKYAVGDTVRLTYYGEVKIFRVVHKNYKTTNKIVLVSEDNLTNATWATGGANNYSTSDLRTFLNSTVLSGFSDEIQNAIVVTSVACHNNTTAVTCKDKIWALSYAEVGLGTNTYAPAEGSALSYFNSAARRIKYLNGTAAYWWLRTPYTSPTNYAWLVSSSGSGGNSNVTHSYGVVPAFEI